jgi:hypothetical protein
MNWESSKCIWTRHGFSPSNHHSWLWFSAGAWILGRARDVSDIVSDICNVDLSFIELQNGSFFVLVSGFHAAPLSVLGGDLGCCLNLGRLHSKLCWMALG